MKTKSHIDSHLLLGGGRNDVHGWTKQKLRTCRRNLSELGKIHSCITITMEEDRCPNEYIEANNIIRSICRRSELPCVCVWEGPNPHCHIAFGSPVPDSVIKVLKRRMNKFWIFEWGVPMLDKYFHVDSNPRSDESVKYLGKEKKGRLRVKSNNDWLVFCPWWKSRVLLDK